MADGESQINWPEGHSPEESAFHAVNELLISAEPEVVWAWICRPDLWGTYYSNAKFIKHLGGPWPKLELEGCQYLPVDAPVSPLGVREGVWGLRAREIDGDRRSDIENSVQAIAADRELACARARDAHTARHAR